ncbi:hypothetical protein [Actinokineospora iranica]|uniref:Peptidase inhibitor family I36 n=1 Tax=Actinokineospora iranica TaxID=1271860 RepID=A0A1G6VA29_9PSEU|nr:hypothetical protein [Actinokineospora iranica]SDD50452.1 hypothetical protein SAMN05216174_11219 [Actinokineospora iranica]
MATKKTARALAALAATAALTTTVAATPAAATAESGKDCGWYTCVSVDSTGLRVNSMRGYVTGTDPTKNFYGFYRFFIGSWKSDSSTGRWWTYSEDVVVIPPQTTWPNGTLACMVPMQQNTFDDGFHELERPHCVTLRP